MGNGCSEVLATVKNGEMSGLSGRFLIDCPRSKSAQTEIGGKCWAASGLP